MHDFNPQSILIGLKVKTNARTNVIGDYIDIDGKKYLQLAISSIAEKGKANKEIISFLSKEWKISKINLEIIRGFTNNYKILAVKNINYSYLNSILKHYIV